jgi:glycosyltransferase involved in cell wall biosynthesis
MKFALFTNIPSPHQIPLGNILADKLGEDFSLVCWEPIGEDRTKLGWIDDSNRKWILKAWTSESTYKKALDIFFSADVVVYGYAPISLVNERVNSGKLTFLNTERPFKRGRWRILDPRVLKGMYNTIKLSHKKNYQLLAIGPYCVDDFRFLRAFKNQMWRWGYFPEFPAQQRQRKPGTTATILWAGRMLPLKRVDLLLNSVAWVRANGTERFYLRIIGNGSEEGCLKLLAARLGLMDICSFENSMPNSVLKQVMKEADIYVFPSDKNEGWGVVVNEAMCQGCCVIGSRNAGAVPWLIKDGVNGYTFEGNDALGLGQLIQTCLKNPESSYALGVAAQETMNLWSPKEAAERLLNLSQLLLNGQQSPYNDGGPCSPA